jgi:hypothetical protein
MKLDSKISVQPPPYSDHNGKITHPEPIQTDTLYITYVDNPQDRTIHVDIEKFDLPLILYSDHEYDELGDWTKKQLNDRIKFLLGDNPSKVLRKLFNPTMEENPHSPGTVLSTMIKSLGIHMSDSCSCKRHALAMNEQGNDWCEQNIDTIVGWLRDEAKRRGLPFVDMIGRIMVTRAIKKSRKLLANQPVPDNDEDLDKE